MYMTVLILHAHEDIEISNDIKKRLSEVDWIIPKTLDEILPIDHNWKSKLKDEMKKARALLICLTKNSVSNKKIIQKEIKYALDVADDIPREELFILPLSFEEYHATREFESFHCLLIDRANTTESYYQILYHLSFFASR